jgi:hypothetical protein
MDGISLTRCPLNDLPFEAAPDLEAISGRTPAPGRIWSR